MWTAITDRIKTVAPAAVPQLQRQFLYDRLLARVFTHAPDAWVLKGGTALLARVRDARHSRDVDLNRTAGTLEEAVQELRAAAATDLKDHVRFTTAPNHRMHPPRAGQPGQGNARLQITPTSASDRCSPSVSTSSWAPSSRPTPTSTRRRRW